MRRIVLASIKGGVGKSVTATALAIGLARRGRRTLLVDCDSSANATWLVMGGQGIDAPTLAEVLTRRADAEDAIRPTAIPGLDILPADEGLNGANVALVGEVGRDTRLRSALTRLGERWDAVILDTGPSITTVLVNALVYASEAIIPVDAAMLSVLGLVKLERTIDEIRDAYGSDVRLGGLLLTRVARNNVARDVEATLRERYGELVFRTTIPASVKVEEGHTRGQSVLEYAPKSPAASAYEKLVSEVLNDGREEDGSRGPSRRSPGAADAA